MCNKNKTNRSNQIEPYNQKMLCFEQIFCKPRKIYKIQICLFKGSSIGFYVLD